MCEDRSKVAKNSDVIYGYSLSKKSGLLMACCPKAHLTMLLGKIYLSCNEACLQSHTYGVSGFFFRNFYTFLRNRKEVKIVLTLHLIEFQQTLIEMLSYKISQTLRIGIFLWSLISKNQGLEKIKVYFKPQKISGSANLDFFFQVSTLKKLGLDYKPKKNTGAKPLKKKSRFVEPKIFLPFPRLSPWRNQTVMHKTDI